MRDTYKDKINDKINVIYVKLNFKIKIN